MPDEPTGQEPTEPTTTDTTAEPTGDAGGGSAGADEFDRDRAMATINKLREKEKQGRADARRADEAEAKLRAIEDANKSDAQKQAERLAAYEAKEATWASQRQDLELRLAAHALADSAGIADVDLALAALDRSKVEWADGRPTNLAEVVDDLLEAKPLLRKGGRRTTTSTTDAGAGRTPGPTPDLNAEELAMAQRLGMTPERYAAMRGVTTVADYERLRQQAD